VTTLIESKGSIRLNRVVVPVVSMSEARGREEMRRTWIAVLALALVAASCATQEDPAADETTTTQPPATTQLPEVSEGTLTVSSSGLGDILTDGAGMTLYLFVPDAQGESVCYDECAAAWPPLVGDVSAGDGADASILSSTERTDGSRQATYNGWPLYYFASDSAPGDTNGQGLNDVWYVLDGAGEGIGLATSTPVELRLASTDLGDILSDSDGNTLYLFVPDAQGESVCYDQCEAAWPPLVGDVNAGDGVDGSLLGTAERTDGSVQVTYDGWPLYYFANDAAPGDTNGQGLNDVWYVVDAAGDAVGLSASVDIVVAESELGAILTDGDGNTLYVFDPDAQGESVCYDQCEAAWPPFVAEAVAGDGVDGSLLGTAERTDGSVQVTYDGWPLYYFANDAAPGDTNGQGINDVWWVVDADGNAVK
jgi:predicted lipoprotein with Yx(FWY)xxD motif